MGNRFFEEIKARGYQGSFKTVKTYLCRVRKECEFPKEISLSYYKGYIKKRLEEVQPSCVSAKKLFHEITAKGYRGSFSTLRGFLCTLRKKVKMTRKISLHFHKDYLIKRIENAAPNFVPTKQLLKEIRDQGYRGSLRSLQEFLSTVRNKEEMLGKNPLCDYKAKIHKSMSSEKFLQFHKNYILKRVKETCPDYLSTKQIFEEITARGYRGSVRTLQAFLSTNRKKSETSLERHKDYLMQKVGRYQGSLSMPQRFLSEIPQKKEAFLQSHKDYLIQKVEKLSPDCVSAKQLFEDMTARGYRGTHKEIEVFLMMISK